MEAHAATVEGDHVEVGHLFRTRRNQIRQDQLVSFSHGLSSRRPAFVLVYIMRRR
jgi:hypothetical protein